MFGPSLHGPLIPVLLSPFSAFSPVPFITLTAESPAWAAPPPHGRAGDSLAAEWGAMSLFRTDLPPRSSKVCIPLGAHPQNKHFMLSASKKQSFLKLEIYFHVYAEVLLLLLPKDACFVCDRGCEQTGIFLSLRPASKGRQGARSPAPGSPACAGSSITAVEPMCSLLG